MKYKIKIITGILTVLVLTSVKVQVVSDWENPHVTGINKEPATATFSSYSNEKDALLFKWAEKGFVVSREQFVLSDFILPELSQSKTKKISYSEKQNSIKVKGENFTVEFNSKNGALTSFVFGNKGFITKPLEPYFWKPLNNNQERNSYVRRLGDWKNAAENKKVIEVKVSENRQDNQITIDFDILFGFIFHTFKN